MAKKPISQRLRELHSDLLRLSADASLDRRFETVMAANDVWVFDIWATVRSATTIDLFGIQTNTKPGAPDTTEAR